MKYYKFKIKLLDPSTFNTINHQHSTANPDPQPTHCHHNQHPSKNQPHSEKKKKNWERSLTGERKRGRQRIERRTKPIKPKIHGGHDKQNPSNPRPTVAQRPPESQNLKFDLKPMAIRSEAHDHRSETTATPIWNPLPRRSKTTATQSRSWERILTVKGREERAWDRKEKRLREESEKWEEGRVWEIKNQFFFTNSWTVLSLQPRKEQNCKRIHVRFSKFFVNYTQKKKILRFLFYIATFINHLRQFIYFTRYFNKIFILSLFFLLFLTTTILKHTRALPLSLLILQITSLSLSHTKTIGSLFLFHSSLGPFFTCWSKSFLHRSIHEPSSSDPDPFFTDQSTNQAPRPRSLLHRLIHEPSSGDSDPFFTNRSKNQAPHPRSLLH